MRQTSNSENCELVVCIPMAISITFVVVVPQVYGFYKGMALPVLSVAICSSVCFGTYRNSLHFLCQFRHGSSALKPSRLDVFVAGCAAGAAEVSCL